MYTIVQQGEQGNMFYTLQVNGNDLDHFCTLEAACIALETVKVTSLTPQDLAGNMERWLPAGEGGGSNNEH